MLQFAEDIVRKKYPQCQSVAVISGIGARGYYKKQGYNEQDEYMIKYFDKE